MTVWHNECVYIWIEAGCDFKTSLTVTELIITYDVLLLFSKEIGLLTSLTTLTVSCENSNYLPNLITQIPKQLLKLKQFNICFNGNGNRQYYPDFVVVDLLLSSLPNIPNIEVNINGVVITLGWTFTYKRHTNFVLEEKNEQLSMVIYTK